ncbi:MAG: DUF1614 domain-containing protein [Bacillota bacterium]
MIAGFPIGVLVLVGILILTLLGFTHRVLDRMRLTDKAALAILALMIVGSFINIPIPFPGVRLSVNVGGGIVPIGVAIYVLSRAGTSKEWIRALVSTAITAAAILLINRYVLPADPWQTGADIIDPLLLYPIVAGVVAYIAGRSRRSSFIAATLGVLVADIYDMVYLVGRGIPGVVAIAGAGVLDAIVLAGIVAVLLAEIIGETRERIQGGPQMEGRPEGLMKGLRNSSILGKAQAKKGLKERTGDRLIGDEPLESQTANELGGDRDEIE